jgi:hypothetical protein
MIRTVRDVIRVLKMPCREHTELFSRQLDGAITPGEAIGLRLHLLLCAGCRRFKAHLGRLRDMTRMIGEAGMGEAVERLPRDVRDRAVERARAVPRED